MSHYSSFCRAALLVAVAAALNPARAQQEQVPSTPPADPVKAKELVTRVKADCVAAKKAAAVAKAQEWVRKAKAYIEERLVSEKGRIEADYAGVTTDPVKVAEKTTEIARVQNWATRSKEEFDRNGPGPFESYKDHLEFHPEDWGPEQEADCEPATKAKAKATKAKATKAKATKAK